MTIKTSATYYINNDDKNVIKVFEDYIKFVTEQTENIKIAERQEKKKKIGTKCRLAWIVLNKIMTTHE